MLCGLIEIRQKEIETVNHVRVWAKVKLDGTGNTTRLPVILLLIDGKLTILEPLLQFFVKSHKGRGHSWMTKLCEIVGQLLDYINADHGRNEKPVQLFESFVSALYNGTFDKENRDPSCLCWLPSKAKTINPKLYSLEEFSDWMARAGYVPESLNPWTAATNAEQKFNWLAWYRQNQYSFLGHLGLSNGRFEDLEQARKLKLRRQPMGKNGSPKAFPADYEMALFRDGFVRPGKENHEDILEKFDWRGICIAMLLIYGARRLSEPFHLWSGDVMENPSRPGEALVRIYHPVEGAAPQNPKINGRPVTNRQAYLQAFYPGYGPRDSATGNYHAGFKGRAFTDDKALFIHVHWLPSDMAEAFMWAYHNYMQQRAKLGLHGSRHPFAFVTHQGKNKGEPYTIRAFEATWKRAVLRIGLPYGKIYGTTPHGGRHGTGVRANRGGVSQSDAQEMFAHSSPESQRTYRSPSPEQVTESLVAATIRIQDEHPAGEIRPRAASFISAWTNTEQTHEPCNKKHLFRTDKNKWLRHD